MAIRLLIHFSSIVTALMTIAISPFTSGSVMPVSVREPGSFWMNPGYFAEYRITCRPVATKRMYLFKATARRYSFFGKMRTNGMYRSLE